MSSEVKANKLSPATGTNIQIGDTTDNVGIGTTTPSSYNSYANNLVVYEAGHGGITIATGIGNHASLYFADGTTGDEGYRGYLDYDHADDSLDIGTGGSARVRINSSGNVAIGTTATNSYKLKVYETTNADVSEFRTGETGSSNTGMILFRDGSNDFCGQITCNPAANTTSYNTSSDYRLKENVVPMTGSIDRIKQLNPFRFNFISDPDTTFDGFLAHEVSDLVPEATTGTKDDMRTEEYEITPADGDTPAVMGTREVPEYQGIDQSKLVPLLTSALQEAVEKIEELTTRIEVIEASQQV